MDFEAVRAVVVAYGDFKESVVLFDNKLLVVTSRQTLVDSVHKAVAEDGDNRGVAGPQAEVAGNHTLRVGKRRILHIRPEIVPVVFSEMPDILPIPGRIFLADGPLVLLADFLIFLVRHKGIGEGIVPGRLD